MQVKDPTILFLEMEISEPAHLVVFFVVSDLKAMLDNTFPSSEIRSILWEYMESDVTLLQLSKCIGMWNVQCSKDHRCFLFNLSPALHIKNRSEDALFWRRRCGGGKEHIPGNEFHKTHKQFTDLCLLIPFSLQSSTQ